MQTQDSIRRMKHDGTDSRDTFRTDGKRGQAARVRSRELRQARSMKAGR